MILSWSSSEEDHDVRSCEPILPFLAALICHSPAAPTCKARQVPYCESLACLGCRRACRVLNFHFCGAALWNSLVRGRREWKSGPRDQIREGQSKTKMVGRDPRNRSGSGVTISLGARCEVARTTGATMVFMTSNGVLGEPKCASADDIPYSIVRKHDKVLTCSNHLWIPSFASWKMVCSIQPPLDAKGSFEKMKLNYRCKKHNNARHFPRFVET